MGRTAGVLRIDRPAMDMGLDGAGSSSSLESTNRLWYAGRSSSSSLESANLLFRLGFGFCWGSGLEDLLNPKDDFPLALVFRRVGASS